ncbi:hypothetical protein BLOT_001956 [Blomia tropicalis]|nr:hypothetical protein BLOT_001956 [Blomia tropicalis]
MMTHIIKLSPTINCVVRSSSSLDASTPPAPLSVIGATSEPSPGGPFLLGGASFPESRKLCANIISNLIKKFNNDKAVTFQTNIDGIIFIIWDCFLQQTANDPTPIHKNKIITIIMIQFNNLGCNNWLSDEVLDETEIIISFGTLLILCCILSLIQFYYYQWRYQRIVLAHSKLFNNDSTKCGINSPLSSQTTKQTSTSQTTTTNKTSSLNDTISR